MNTFNVFFFLGGNKVIEYKDNLGNTCVVVLMKYKSSGPLKVFSYYVSSIENQRYSKASLHNKGTLEATV